MSTIYYPSSPLLFETEIQAMAYFNSGNAVESVGSPSLMQGQQTGSVNVIARLLLLSGFVILLIVIIKEVNRNREKELNHILRT